MKSKLHCLRKPILSQRIRQIGGQGFAFIPHRFLKDEFLTSLDRNELALYVFLLLAANRYGVSFYGYDAICSVLRMPVETYINARNGLIDKDLIAFDGSRFQVLSLPKSPKIAVPKPLTCPADFAKHDSATIRSILLDQFGPVGDEDD
jgi:hypothetical protein